MYICFRNLFAVVSGQRVCACVCVWGGGGELKTFPANSLPCLNLKIEITFFSLQRFLYL